MMDNFKKTISQPSGLVGFILLIVVALVAILGPYIAPHSPTEQIAMPGQPPGDGLFLGADYLGRDVFSRLLNGGGSVIAIGLSATLLAYAVGVILGLIAGYVEGVLGAVIMRTLDVVLAFPPLLVLLLLVGGFQPHVWVLIVGVVIVQVPGVVRVTRAATASVARASYVEAAQARGDSVSAIWRRDIFPNILPTVLADFGIRFGLSIILVASMNFLGLGMAPPASDWGLMTSENQSFITLNPLSVVAPAAMLAVLSVGVNLVADAYLKVVDGRSKGRNRRRRASTAGGVVAPKLTTAPTTPVEL